jgi:hypothetical protein
VRFSIQQGTLTAGSNYTLTFVPNNFGITPAPLTITADDKTKAFGAPNPPFTATTTGFKFADTFGNLTGTLAFATPATTTSPPGVYTITPSGVSSGNYTITFVNGDLVVGQGAPPTDQALIPRLGGARLRRPKGCRRARRSLAGSIAW